MTKPEQIKRLFEGLFEIDQPAETQLISNILKSIFNDPRLLVDPDAVGNTKKIANPQDEENRLFITEAQGLYPLSYMETEEGNERIGNIFQLGYIPSGEQRKLVKSSMHKAVGIESLAKKNIVTDREEILIFLKKVQQKIDERSGVVSTESSANELPLELQELQLQSPEEEFTGFTQLRTYTAEIGTAPVDSCIDVQKLLDEGDANLVAGSLHNEEIKALQVAANMLFTEVTLPNKKKKELLPALQKLLEIFRADNMRNDTIRVFMSVLVPKIDEYMETNVRKKK